MKKNYMVAIGLVALALVVFTSVTLASTDSAKPTPTLVEAVRQATAPFKDVTKAEKAGYALLHGCVSGPQDGAMGIHYANGSLVGAGEGDGTVDVAHPEALLYAPLAGGKLQLLGVEYVVLADGWNAKHEAPPVLMGQLFNYVGTPNRYGLPAFYELHVWAWENNPDGIFADWNRNVSCEPFAGDPTHEGHH